MISGLLSEEMVACHADFSLDFLVKQRQLIQGHNGRGPSDSVWFIMVYQLYFDLNFAYESQFYNAYILIIR